MLPTKEIVPQNKPQDGPGCRRLTQDTLTFQAEHKKQGERKINSSSPVCERCSAIAALKPCIKAPPTGLAEITASFEE
jgi:hypothetical protein